MAFRPRAFTPSEFLADKLDDDKLLLGENIFNFILMDKMREIPRGEKEAYEVVINKDEVFSNFLLSGSSEKEIDPNILKYVRASLKEDGWEEVQIDTDSNKIRIKLILF